MTRQVPRSTRSITGALLCVTACGGDPTRPAGQTTPHAPSASFALSAQERGELSAALRFAGQQSARGLQRREAADRVAAAFAALSERVGADDPIGAERELAGARAAIREYRRLATAEGGAADVDLEAMSLTLDRATAIVREGQSTKSTSNSER